MSDRYLDKFKSNITAITKIKINHLTQRKIMSKVANCIILENNKSSLKQLNQFFERVNDYFEPPLKMRILNKSSAKNLQEYLTKILNNASCIVIKNDDEISALLVIYHNDKVSFKSYIPVLAVLNKFSGLGYATTLMTYAEKIVKKSGMKEILVNTWTKNTKAIQFYKNRDYNLISIDDDIVEFKKKL